MVPAPINVLIGAGGRPGRWSRAGDEAEHQPAAVHLGQLRLDDQARTPTGLARRCSSVTDVPTVVSPLGQLRRHGRDRGRLGQRKQPRGAEHGHVPAAQRRCRVGLAHHARTEARSPTARGVLAIGSSLDDGDQVAFLDDVALGHGQLGQGAVALGEDRDLHLHRLQDDQRVAVLPPVALGGHDLPHVRDHLRTDLGSRAPPWASSPGRPAAGPRAPSLSLPAWRGPQPGNHGRVVGAAGELVAVQQLGEERKVRLGPGDHERRRPRRPGQRERLVPARAVHAQLGQQRVVERGHLVAGRVARVDPDAGPGGSAHSVITPGLGRNRRGSSA